jgi:hypothetical protein
MWRYYLLTALKWAPVSDAKEQPQDISEVMTVPARLNISAENDTNVIHGAGYWETCDGNLLTALKWVRVSDAKEQAQAISDANVI